MNFGSGNIGYELPNGPGASGARNGLSTSAGFNVLGQDSGDATNPAILLNNREIPTGPANELVIIDKSTGAFMQLGNRSLLPGYYCINIDGSATRIPAIRISNPNAITYKTWRFEASATGNGELIIFDQIAIFFRMSRDFSSISSPFFMFQNVVDTAISLGLVTTINRPRCVFTNRGAAGAITITLPVTGTILYAEYTFTIVAAFTLTIQAPGGSTIRIGAVVSGVGGTVSAAAVGSSVRLQQISATEWQAIAVVGAWVTP